ncbi:hypothetical protein DID78_03775 [Candidatus Marinamargulisbacteria bacterium SCGC AG-343-D04]|nr:hypothetical protein DID78_03775 [Candidatus Marinamargulisbacteria bacterium SCGC AG-343-D04]
MNLNVIAGFVIAFFALYFGAPDMREDIVVYLRVDAFVLVFFGTLASTLISSSFEDFGGLFKILRRVIFGKRQFVMPYEMIKILVDLSQNAQNMSRQALGDSSKGINDMFLTRSLEMVGAGLEKDFIIQTLEADIIEVKNRHLKMVSTVRTMGSFAPMFGMAGTVIGVIQVLKNVTDIDNIVGGMALALLTTLYGLFFSSLLFIPLSNKLKNLSDQEVLAKEIVVEGMNMVLDKEIPLKVEKHLTSFIHSSRKDLEKKK